MPPPVSSTGRLVEHEAKRPLPFVHGVDVYTNHDGSVADWSTLNPSVCRLFHHREPFACTMSDRRRTFPCSEIFRPYFAHV